ncbi:LysR family transcriptional regulator [Paraburkholderia acidisoli]|uniref:LysR family transcriptional regulator n=1 Tax=Paraburkholderia acidisoli TaxID=2571748 RepID=A0A7Z2GQY9_9BURK|nr:LysR family transcriptional regulator [Paraburkholderia acidisoli]QGZ66145.1 LysR family transcriptional regulator [Paraburkholderia acidisoli]
MKIHQLRALVEVAAAGTLKGAAHRLHVTQPAVTKAIRELEDEFGVRLFERNPWGVVPTAEGVALLQRARTVVREMERAEEDLAHMKGQREGRLVIGVSPIAGTAGLAEAFVEFRQRWPQVAIEFVELGLNQLREQLRSRAVDLAFAAFPVNPGEDDVQVKALLSFDAVFVTRANGAFARATSLEALQDAEWIHTDVTDNYPGYIQAMFSRAGLEPPRRVTRCTSYGLFYGLTVRSDAVFAWTRHSLEEAELGRAFVELKVEARPPSLQLYLFSPPEAQLTRPAEYFVDCILEVTAQRMGQPRASGFASDR